MDQFDKAQGHELLSVLTKLLSKSPEERELLLRDHPELAQQLRRLLESQKEQDVATDEKYYETITLLRENVLTDTATIHETVAAPGNDLPPPGDPMPDRGLGPGVRLQGYELLEEIARGGMGVVFKARQLGLNRIVAIKVIRSGELAGQDEIDRFHAEAEAAAHLDHPNIVPVYEVGELDGRHFFSMGYVDGESLAARIARQPKMDLRAAARLMHQIVAAVEFAHDQGIIHRDLKPANVLLENDDRPRLTDFGLAKRLEGDSGITASGMVMGTPSYMPPEQALGHQQDIGPLSDVYSLGAILYELMTGQPPHRDESPVATMMSVINKEITPPRSLRRDIPPDLETICCKCLSREPSERYPSCTMLRLELERFLADEPIVARPLGRAKRTWRWIRRKPIAAGLIAASAIAVIAVGVAGAVAWKARESQQLVDLRRSIDHTLDSETWDEQRLQEFDSLLAELQRLNPKEVDPTELRLEESLIASFDRGLQDPTIDPSDLERLEETLALVEQRIADPELLQAKREALRRRLRFWEQVFQLDAPFENLGEIFTAGAVQTDDQQLVRIAAPVDDDEDPTAKPASARVVSTLVPSPGQVQLAAEFTNWESAAQIGVLLNLTDTHGYRFMLTTRDNFDENVAADSFEQLKGTARPLILQVMRNDTRLIRREHRISEVNTPELTLVCRRTGDMLTFQVNDLPPLIVRDLFPLDTTAAGVFALDWPQQASLVRLSGSRRAAPVASSSLERGDALYGEGRYTEALDHYQRQAIATGDGELGQMARYKAGICQLALRRLTEAAETFEELAAEPGDEWPPRAACQLWLVRLRQKRRDEADRLLDALTIRYGFEELASLIPPDDRERILSHYEATSHTSGYRGMKWNPNRVRNMERIVAVQKLVNSSRNDQLGTQFELMQTYHHGERLNEAIELCEELLDQTDISVWYRCNLLDSYSWLLMRMDRHEDALSAINEWLNGDEPGEVMTAYLRLLVSRAQVYAQLEDFDSAERDIGAFLQLTEGQTTDSGVTAFLVAGFVLEAQDRDETAEKYWLQGFEFAREQQRIASLQATVLGSLSNSITEEDAKLIAGGVARSGPTNAALQFLRQKVAPAEDIHAVLSNMWRTERGREYARKMAFRELPFAEANGIQTVLAAAEICRLGLEGSYEPLGSISSEVEELIWETSRNLLDAYSQDGTVDELGIARLGLTFKGTSGIFGWEGVAPTLPKELRGPLAYLFHLTYLRLERPEEAEKFLETAKADVLPGSKLDKILQQLPDAD